MEMDGQSERPARIWQEVLRSGLEGLGIGLRPEQMGLFERYLDFLRQENEQLNLTSIVEPLEVATKHFVDSATVLAVAQPALGESAVDVGSGGGFPGVPLAILRSDLRITLVESVQKKAAFLERLREELSLGNVRVVAGRAEEVGRHRGHRERYGLAVARAVAPLGVVWEYLLPLVRVGGVAVAQKGPSVAEELSGGERAARALGAGEQRVREFTLPEGAGERRVVLVDKVKPCPEQYPRRTGVPAKKPL